MKILFTTHPASGHLHPLVPLAQAAKEAGHAVRFAISRSLCPTVERLGFRAFPAGADYDDPEVARLMAEAEWFEGLEHAAFAIEKIFGGVLVERMLPDLDTIFDDWKPDLVVAEVSEFASWLLARRRGVPRANVLFGLYATVNALGDFAARALDPLSRRLGLGPIEGIEFFAEETSLLFAPESYQLPEIPLPAGAHLIRPVVFDQSGEETLPGWITERRERPLVYATLGTIFNNTPGLLERVAEALGEEDLDLVITVGRDRDPASLGPVPANVRVERYIPHSLLFPRCDALIAHGGYGTAMAGLCHGLPMILVPLGADQPLHALRCEALGAALVLERQQLTPPVIRESTRKILEDPSYRARSRAVAREIASLPGMDEAVRILEALARPIDRLRRFEG